MPSNTEQQSPVTGPAAIPRHTAPDAEATPPEPLPLIRPRALLRPAPLPRVLQDHEIIAHRHLECGHYDECLAFAEDWPGMSCQGCPEWGFALFADLSEFISEEFAQQHALEAPAHSLPTAEIRAGRLRVRKDIPGGTHGSGSRQRPDARRRRSRSQNRWHRRRRRGRNHGHDARKAG